MVNSREKGNRGERDIVKRWVQWWQDRFERRSMGYAGADLICPDWFPWDPEVKNHKTARVKWLFQPTAQLLAWWKQATDQAIVTEKIALLVLKAEGIWFAIRPPLDQLDTGYPINLNSQDLVFSTLDHFEIVNKHRKSI